MTTTIDTPRGTPWHFWLLAGIGLLWNAYGGYDFVMSQTSGEPYLRSAGMTASQIEHFHAMPPWMIGMWALGVWGAVVGSILLLLRSRWAFHAFVASLAGFAVSLVYNYVLTKGWEVYGPPTAIMNVVIGAVIIFFIWYSRRMAVQGVLR